MQTRRLPLQHQNTVPDSPWPPRGRSEIVPELKKAIVVDGPTNRKLIPQNENAPPRFSAGRFGLIKLN
jgi:hypothetical protein